LDIETVVSACYTVLDGVIFQKGTVYSEEDRLLAVRANNPAGLCRYEIDLALAGPALHEYNFRHETPDPDTSRFDIG